MPPISNLDRLTHLQSPLDNWNCYWQVGVDFVLAGDMTEAQSTWLAPFLQADSSAAAVEITNSLANFLDQAADQQQSLDDFDNTVNLRQFLRELLPNNINNLLKLISLSIHNQGFEIISLHEWSVIAVLQEAKLDSISQEALDQGILAVLELFQPSDIELITELVAICLKKSPHHLATLSLIASQTFVLSHRLNRPECATKILEVCLDNSPENVRSSIQCSLTDSMARAGQINKAIAIAQDCYHKSLVLSTEQQVRASHNLLFILMKAGDWIKIPVAAQNHRQLLQGFIEESPNQLVAGGTIINSSYFLNYLYDDPQQLHFFRNAIGEIYTKNLKAVIVQSSSSQITAIPKKAAILRIGYIASTLRKHSVGWLSRWLFAHHDRQQLEIFLYHVNQQDDDPFNHKFFRDKVHISSYFETDVAQIVNQIKEDEIDILVDLDSLALSITYEVMCHKPAPVQVTWLGWDASGCPAIDYYIADPYVLPPDADEYYSAQIWRLPHTYLAIDGFESEVPSRKRVDYDLPEDAIVYLCNQASYKHHPDILRLQLQIIKSVPNSYLLIKLQATESSLVNIYQVLTNEIGIGMDRLRFLKSDPSEGSHRANLTLADVALDTFPYNGATTTLETLWMNVPMVTKVGAAFVARNSYTFMKNAGITEGIAWTDEEYVDWGTRLGTDSKLRQQVRGKLITSRKTSPLWNAQRFTKDMENAYQSMWQKHLEQQN
jgi:predicted O-linked N-acetylglucosamine transferase (SPINDLY family)